MYQAALISFLLVLAQVPRLAAVQVYGDDGSAHAVAPEGAAGEAWAHVGAIGGASCVYLGNYDTGAWVVTVAHVAASDSGLVVNLNGSSYTSVAGSGQRLLNADGTIADLYMFRIDRDAGLSALPVARAAPVMGGAVTLIGNGVVNNTALTHWNADWSVSASPSVYSGYTWGGVNRRQWGTGVVSCALTSYVAGARTSLLLTAFEAKVGSAAGATGDSGGGMFVETASGVELCGLMDAIGGHAPGQPWGTTIVGNVTYSADLFVYAPQIESLLYATAVPEPRATGVAAGAVGVALAFGAKGRAVMRRPVPSARG